MTNFETPVFYLNLVQLHLKSMNLIILFFFTAVLLVNCKNQSENVNELSRNYCLKIPGQTGDLLKGFNQLNMNKSISAFSFNSIQNREYPLIVLEFSFNSNSKKT